MEAALADVSEALDAVEAGMGGRDHAEAAAAAARLPSRAALLRRSLDRFVAVSCRDAQEKYLAAKLRHAALRARAAQLRRQHEALGLEWHEDIESADAHDARRAAASALAAYGREAKLECSASLARLTASDQAHLELLFREGLGIDRNRARARWLYKRASNRRAAAQQEALRVDEAITRGMLTAQSGRVSVLRAWAAFFRQVERTFARSAESCVEDDGGGPQKTCGDDGSECDESASITDRVCFDVSYKYEQPGGRAAEALETLSFRTRRGFKSARIWIQAVCAQKTASVGEGPVAPLLTFRSDMRLPTLVRDGASFLSSAQPSTLFVSAFISGCVWPDLTDDEALHCEPAA